jgi:hypothetical protein
MRPTASISSRPSCATAARRSSAGSAWKSMPRARQYSRIEIGVPKLTQA